MKAVALWVQQPHGVSVQARAAGGGFRLYQLSHGARGTKHNASTPTPGNMGTKCGLLGSETILGHAEKPGSACRSPVPTLHGKPQ